jgi:hypothetical protein
MARRRQWRDGPARGPRGLVWTLRRWTRSAASSWCAPLAAGLVTCALLALVLPWIGTAAQPHIQSGRLRSMMEFLASVDIRLMSTVGALAFILGALASSWRYLADPHRPAPQSHVVRIASQRSRDGRPLEQKPR